MATAKIHVIVPHDLKRWLAARARKEERSLSNYVSRLLNDYYQERRGEGPPLTPPPTRGD